MLILLIYLLDYVFLHDYFSMSFYLFKKSRGKKQFKVKWKVKMQHSTSTSEMTAVRQEYRRGCQHQACERCPFTPVPWMLQQPQTLKLQQGLSADLYSPLWMRQNGESLFPSGVLVLLPQWSWVAFVLYNFQNFILCYGWGTLTPVLKIHTTLSSPSRGWWTFTCFSLCSHTQDHSKEV